MPFPVNISAYGTSTGNGTASAGGLLSTVSDVLTVAQQGANVYSSINVDRHRPAPTSNSNNANGDAKDGSQQGPSMVGIFALGAIVLIGGFLAVRYLAR